MNAIELLSYQDVAIKVFKKRNMNTACWITAHFEYDIMRRLEHPNIVSVEDFFEDHHYICFAMEKMDQDLRSYLCNAGRILPEDQVRNFFHQMVQSIRFCHKNGVIHRDIKLENFLLKTTKKGEIKVNLCDFGLACIYDALDPPNDQCGSLVSVAPEILSGEQPYCPKVDCWSLGVALYELLSTDTPFHHKDDEVFENNIMT